MPEMSAAHLPTLGSVSATAFRTAASSSKSVRLTVIVESGVGSDEKTLASRDLKQRRIDTFGLGKNPMEMGKLIDSCFNRDCFLRGSYELNASVFLRRGLISLFNQFGRGRAHAVRKCNAFFDQDGGLAVLSEVISKDRGAEHFAALFPCYDPPGADIPDEDIATIMPLNVDIGLVKRLARQSDVSHRVA
jgi:hypothetical protein